MASAHSGSLNILKRKAQVNEGFPFILLFGKELTLTALAKIKGSSVEWFCPVGREITSGKHFS